MCDGDVYIFLRFPHVFTHTLRSNSVGYEPIFKILMSLNWYKQKYFCNIFQTSPFQSIKITTLQTALVTLAEMLSIQLFFP